MLLVDVNKLIGHLKKGHRVTYGYTYKSYDGKIRSKEIMLMLINNIVTMVDTSGYLESGGFNINSEKEVEELNQRIIKQLKNSWGVYSSY